MNLDWGDVQHPITVTHHVSSFHPWYIFYIFFIKTFALSFARWLSAPMFSGDATIATSFLNSASKNTWKTNEMEEVFSLQAHITSRQRIDWQTKIWKKKTWANLWINVLLYTCYAQQHVTCLLLIFLPFTTRWTTSTSISHQIVHLQLIDINDVQNNIIIIIIIDSSSNKINSIIESQLALKRALAKYHILKQSWGRDSLESHRQCFGEVCWRQKL